MSLEYTLNMWSRGLLSLFIGALAGSPALAQEPADFTLSGDWDVRVTLPGSGAQAL